MRYDIWQVDVCIKEVKSAGQVRSSIVALPLQNWEAIANLSQSGPFRRHD
jgi:hypothetical protein